MTSATQDNNEVTIRLSKSEALVFFEWLSRNSDDLEWTGNDLFVDPAEQQLLMWLVADLERILAEPLQADYAEQMSRSYRDIVPDPTEWE